MRAVGDAGTERLRDAWREGTASDGKAEAALERAEARLRGLAGPAVATLEELVTSASSEAVRLAAARDLVDRSVGKAVEKVQVAAQIVVHKPW